MAIYIGSFSLALISSYIYRNQKRGPSVFLNPSGYSKKAEISIFSLILWIVMGLRGSMVGSDTANYSDIFVDIATNGPLSHMMFKRAPVYTLYNALIGIVSKSPQWVVMCNSAIIIFCIGYVIYKESDDAIGSWFCYVTLNYYFFGMNAARQSMAIALSMVVFSLLRQKKYCRAVIIAIVSVLTHSSAAISLVLFPIMFVKNKRKYYFWFLLAIVAFVASFDYLMRFFVRIFPEYSSYLNPIFVQSLGKAAGGRTITALYFLIVIALSFVLYRKKKIENTELYFQLIYLVTVALVPMFLMRNSNISYRIEMYFIEYSILFVPFVFCRIRNKTNRHVVTIIGYSVLLIPYLLKMPAYLPYHFFFEG